jgi:hypothetical protein
MILVTSSKKRFIKILPQQHCISRLFLDGLLKRLNYECVEVRILKWRFF